MNATGYQGIFEAAGHKLNDIGGVMLWKLNAAFPSVIWQVFDWYLQPNSGYYFMQNACEAIHIQLNLLNNQVMILNRSYHPLDNLTAEALVYDLNSRKLYEKKASSNLNSTEVKELFSLSDAIQFNKGISFVDLNLRNKKGEIVSHNFYWLSPDENFLPLNDMNKTEVESSVISKVNQNQEVKWTVRFENKSDKIAFFIHPQIWINEEEILPAFWSSNYFSLAPGEFINASVTVPANKMNNSNTELRIEGWNMDLINIPL